MALLYFDGFDTYGNTNDMSTAGWAISAGLTTNGGRFGGGGISCGNSNAKWSFSGNPSEIWCGGALFFNSTTNTTPYGFIEFGGSVGYELALAMDVSTGTVFVYRGRDIGTLIATYSNIFPTPQNKWHWVEFRYVMDSAAGVLELWVDGTRIINLTGANLKQNSGETGLNFVQFGGFNTNVGCVWDDIYILDTTGAAPYNTRLGDCKVTALAPNSDASPNNGTPSTGTTHYTMVNEAPGPNTTNYVDLTATTGQEERFGIASLSGTIGSIFAVRAVSYAQKTDAGAASAHNEIVSGTSIGAGASWALSTSWGYKSDIFINDPATGAAFANAAAVNALKIGVVAE